MAFRGDRTVDTAASGLDKTGTSGMRVNTLEMAVTDAGNRSTNFTVVQALRGIAALWVVLFHASEGRHVDSLKAALPSALRRVIFDMGHQGVALFFALSGFVIMHGLRNATFTPAFMKRFIIRRSIRLDPPYWLSIVVVVGFSTMSALVKREDYTPPSVGTVLAHMIYLQMFLDMPIINVVYWTLTYEVQFYVFVVAMLVVAHRMNNDLKWRRGTSAAWSVMTLLAVIAIVGIPVALPAGLFIHLWPAFFIGVLAYRAPFDPVATVTMIAMILLMVAIPGEEQDFFRISAVTAAGLSLALRYGWINHGLNWRWLQFLGTVSYSLYLLHNPVTGAAGFLGHRVVGIGVGADVLTLAFILAASIGGATAFWWLVEQPAHRWSRRVGRSKMGNPASPAIAASVPGS